MKGRFMYSQKLYCAASLFPKQNYNVLSPNFHKHVSVSDLYLPCWSTYSVAAKYCRQTDLGHNCTIQVYTYTVYTKPAVKIKVQAPTTYLHN